MLIYTYEYTHTVPHTHVTYHNLLAYNQRQKLRESIDVPRVKEKEPLIANTPYVYPVQQPAGKKPTKFYKQIFDFLFKL